MEGRESERERKRGVWVAGQQAGIFKVRIG
jgi:hypothetical protein